MSSESKYNFYSNDGPAQSGAPTSDFNDEDVYGDTLAQAPDADDMPTGEGSEVEEEDRLLAPAHHKETEQEALERNMAELEAFTFEQPEDVRNDSTGKAAYVAACKQLDGGRGVVLSIPVETVVDKLDREVMVLDHVGLGDRGVRALAEALSINQTVTSLSLVGNNISAAGCYYLCEMLIHNKLIQHLDLGDNQLGKHASVSPDGGVGLMFSQLLSRNNTILSLSLRGNAIGDVDATHICRALAEHRTVQKLDLSHNSIRYRGATEVAAMISSNSELLEIDLSWNQFTTAGSLVILNMNNGLGANNTIKTFKMAWNGVDDTGAEVLARSIGGSVLEEVDISHNRITDKGAESIAKYLRASGASSAIVTLNLNDNPLKDTGCAVILDALRGNKSLTHISLLQTGCGKKALEAASLTLRERPELTIIIPERIALA